MKTFDSEKFKKNGFRLLGEEPFTVNPNGSMQRIHTFFADYRVYITLPGTHADQRLSFIDFLNKERESEGKPQLTSSEGDEIMEEAVSIVIPFASIDKPIIQIREEGDFQRAMNAKKAISLFFPDDQIELLGE